MSSAQQRTRRREQRENTRREILEAADRLLRERPYRELSIDLVMGQTGLTRTAFYRHFDDVPDLVLRLLAEVGQELFAVAERWREGAAEDFVAATRDGLKGIVEFMVSHGRLVRAVAEGAATDEMIDRGYRQFVEVFGDMIGSSLEQLAADGKLKVSDPRALARALNLMNEAFLLDQFGQEPIGDPDVALATLQTIWLRVLPLEQRRSSRS
jgi:TetR/AcrR family transcriptional regulator, ethionamide resistance regulator